MQAGDLRSKVGFYAPVVVSDDGFGNVTNGFSDAADFEVSANIKPRLGGESVLAGRLTGTNYVNITVRQSAQTRAVTVASRVKDERSGTIYNIRSIIDQDQDKPSHGMWLEMLCEEGVAA